jgi:hypothetical protein
MQTDPARFTVNAYSIAYAAPETLDYDHRARAQLVDVALTRWFHCLTRWVRRAFLLGERDHNRKLWLESPLEELADIFAAAVGGFSVLD